MRSARSDRYTAPAAPHQAAHRTGNGSRDGSGSVYSPDGELVETLGGEPPVAQSHGWGDLSWLYWRRRR
jgi:hypothetical protein